MVQYKLGSGWPRGIPPQAFDFEPKPLYVQGPMARVTVEDCLPLVDNRFALVLLGAKRARQLMAAPGR